MLPIQPPVLFLPVALAAAFLPGSTTSQGRPGSAGRPQAAETVHQDPRPDRPANRLAKASSPYLQQHAHNPVDWYPWGPEALERARREDKPIFLSIGYAACHWCHVMERESFENEAIAKLMNEWFVNVKVDREERPDLDEIYMTATQAMTGHGGWPMSVWLTPELQPFYAGTYFPPQDQRGLPGFERVLRHIHGLWTDRRDEVKKQGARVGEFLRKSLAPALEADAMTREHVLGMVEQSASRFDPEHGGFARGPAFAPKFPHASEINVLLHVARTSADEELAAQALGMVTKTLDEMLEGGIHDQIGGGFHRYSVDRRWLVPHFEKMLYDNGQLARTYAEAFVATGDPRYGETLAATLDYLIREMRDPRGGFWSSTDADSEGEEGKFFVWSAEEFDRVVGEALAPIARARFGVSADGSGNWEGHEILTRAAEVDALAERFDLEPEAVEERLATARERLYEARAERVPPGTDDKVLAAWNGLAISGLAAGYRATGEQRFLDAARQAADFVLTSMRAPSDDGRLLRSWRSGDGASLQGYLEDQAFMAEALLALFESDSDPRWLREALVLLDAMREHFLDEADGSFFFTADDHEELLARSKSIAESSVPSGIASAARAFLRAGALLGDEERSAVGRRALRAHHAVLSKQQAAAPHAIEAVAFDTGDPREVVIAGEPDDPRTQALLEAARTRMVGPRVVFVVHRGNREALVELAPTIVAGKEPVDGVPAAYVCTRGVCREPVTEPAALLR